MKREPIQLATAAPALPQDYSERDFAAYAVQRLRNMAHERDRYLGEITFNAEGTIAIAWAYPGEDAP